MGNETMLQYLRGLSDGRTGVIDRCCRHSLSGQPVEPSDPGAIQPDTCVVKYCRANTGLASEKGGKDPTMRTGDNDPARTIGAGL